MNRLGSKHVASAPAVSCAQASSVDLTCHQKITHQSWPVDWSVHVNAITSGNLNVVMSLASTKHGWKVPNHHLLGKPHGTPADPEVQTLGFHWDQNSQPATNFQTAVPNLWPGQKEKHTIDWMTGMFIDDDFWPFNDDFRLGMIDEHTMRVHMRSKWIWIYCDIKLAVFCRVHSRGAYKERKNNGARTSHHIAICKVKVVSGFFK